MLGRGIGISDEKLQHLGDDPLPDGVYSEAEAAVVRYAQRSTRMLGIAEPTYQALAKHFSVQQMIDICLNVGLAQITNRFNATFLSDIDDYIREANEKADRTAGACLIHYPPPPMQAEFLWDSLCPARIITLGGDVHDFRSAAFTDASGFPS
jgi:hypothetical protein